jgi:RNA polymerase sigma-70 factor (ECF subfamily)
MPDTARQLAAPTARAGETARDEPRRWRSFGGHCHKPVRDRQLRDVERTRVQVVAGGRGIEDDTIFEPAWVLACAYQQAALFARSPDAREQLAQEAAARAWEHRRRYDPRRGSPEAWIFGLVRNVAREADRAERRRRSLWQRLLIRQASEYPSRGAVDGAERVREALLELTENEQLVLFLRYWQDLAYDEIARRTGLSAANCRQLAKRGVTRLGRLLR